MLLLVYEYLTGGGLWSESSADCSLLPLRAEAQSMLDAVVQDLAHVPDVQLVQLLDARCPAQSAAPSHVVPVTSPQQELEQLAHWSSRADGTLLIAPEANGRLLERSRIVERAGGRLLSPASSFIELTMDKRATADTLSRAAVPTPAAIHVEDWDEAAGRHVFATLTAPLVIKPVDGVGCMDTYLLHNLQDWNHLARHCHTPPPLGWRVEQYHAGTPVSVAALCGPRGTQLLPPCLQRLAVDHRLSYLGGRYPLSATLSRRACALARQAFAALPATTGYVGIDMSLSDDPESRPDVVLDVNPRLTTSYVGLRQAASVNLAQAMLRIGRGESHPLFFHSTPVEFDADGAVRSGRQPQSAV